MVIKSYSSSVKFLKMFVTFPDKSLHDRCSILNILPFSHPPPPHCIKDSEVVGFLEIELWSCQLLPCFELATQNHMKFEFPWLGLKLPCPHIKSLVQAGLWVANHVARCFHVIAWSVVRQLVQAAKLSYWQTVWLRTSLFTTNPCVPLVAAGWGPGWCWFHDQTR